jgi:predicted AlkP superfamily phosphohydrolase/phosphomutase
MTTPDMDSDWTHPVALKTELLDHVPGYVVDVNLFGKPRAQILAELMRSLDARLDATLYLMDSREWDLLWVTFTESDRVQHRFWQDQQPDHPSHEPEFPDAVDDVYRRLDVAVGALVEAAPEGTRVFVVSDHGFAPFYCAFDATGWLIDKGYTVQRASKASVKRALARVGLLDTAANAYRRFRRVVEAEARHGVDRMRDVADEANTGRTYVDVDWSRTRAYATLDGGIRVNVRGREPHGIVPQEEALDVACEIRDALAALVYPNGEAIFEQVLLASEAFDGPFADRGPDVVMPPRQDAYSGPVSGHRYLVDRHRNSGEHARYGVFIAWGPGIARGTNVASPRLMDIAPTVLNSLGEPPTVEMDGRVLSEVFEDVRRLEATGSSQRGTELAAGLSEDEEALVEERLRGLGYIE